MSAERMAEIEQRVADMKVRDGIIASELDMLLHAPSDLRWLLDRVRELEGDNRSGRELAAVVDEYFDPSNVPAVMFGEEYRRKIAAQDARRTRIVALARGVR